MAPPFTTGITGDLQTVVAALQALTVKIGVLGQVISGALDALDAPSIANQPPPEQIVAHFNTSTSTLLKTGPGALLSVSMNSGVSSTDTITFYDGTSASGTLLGVVSCETIQYLPVPWRFSVGLFAVTVGNADLTISLV